MIHRNILVLSDHLGHENGRIHGATRYFLSVIPQIDASQYRVIPCFLRKHHPVARQLEDQGFNPIFLNQSKWNPLSWLRVSEIIKKHNIHLVHASGMKGILSGRLAARQNKIPCLDHLHDMMPPAFPIQQLIRATNPLSSRTLTISNAVSQFARETLHIDADKCQTLYNGIELAAYQTSTSKSEYLKKWGIPQERLILTIIGRMDANKNQADAICAMPQVLNQLPDAHLLLVGTGPLEHDYRQLANQLGVPATFAGQRDDIAAILSLSTLSIITSRREGFGLTAVESLAAGVPVIAYRTGGIPEVIEHERSGILVETGNVAHLGDEIIRLLKNTDQLALMRQHARQRAATFALATHIHDLQSTYQTLLESDTHES